MNQKFKTILLWLLQLFWLLVSRQLLSNNSNDLQNGTTIAPKNSAVARISYGRFLDYIDAGRVNSVDILMVEETRLLKQIDQIIRFKDLELIYLD